MRVYAGVQKDVRGSVVLKIVPSCRIAPTQCEVSDFLTKITINQFMINACFVRMAAIV